MRHRLALVLSLLILFSIPIEASAHFRFHPDPDDSANKLDMSGYKLAHPKHWAVRVSTYDRFNLKRDGGEFAAYLDVRGGTRWDFVVVMHYDRGSAGYFCDIAKRHGFRNAIREFRFLIRPRSVVCSFGHFKRTKAFRSRVWASNAHGVVVDRAPDNGGFVEHWPRPTS